MRFVLVLLLCACGEDDQVVVPSGKIADLKAITYNMFFGIGSDIFPQDTTPSAIAASINSVLDAIVLTDFRCRIQGAAQTIVAEDPDVIGLQEAVQITYVGARSREDVLVDFVAELLDAIESQSGVRYQSFIRDNTVIEDGLPVVGGIRMADRSAILVHPRFPAERGQSLTFSTLEPASDFVPTAKGAVVRGALHVRVPLQSGSLDLYNTHLQSGSAEAVRVAQAEELASFIADTSGPDSTVIATGDYNDVPASPTYDALVGRGLIDTYGVVGALPGFTAYQPQLLTNAVSTADVRIDYIFVRSANVVDSRIVFDTKVQPCNLWTSDHFGVVSRVSTAANQ